MDKLNKFLFDDNVLPFKFLPKKSDLKDRCQWHWNKSLNGFEIDVPNGKLFYSEHFFNKKISDRSLEYFLENDKYFLENDSNNWDLENWRKDIENKANKPKKDIENKANNQKYECNWRKYVKKEKFSEIQFKNIDWHHDKIKMYGKETYLPRYSAWHGDSDKPYTYSGLTLQPKPWNKGLSHIKKEIEKATDIKFNSVLMNWYRDGYDYINWHTDAEKELGKNPVIGSVSFGAERDFVIRKNKDTTEKIKIPLRHGTLLIMSGELQHYWQHSMPKRENKKDIEEGLRINLTFRNINN